MRLTVLILLPLLLASLGGFAWSMSNAAGERAHLMDELGAADGRVGRAEARVKELGERLARLEADLRAARQREAEELAEALAPSVGGAGERQPVLDARRSEGACPLHHVGLQNRVVPIRYGAVPFGDGAASALEYIEARKREFPFAMLKLGGECDVPENPPRRALVRSCAECDGAERAWVEAHKQRHHD